MLQTSKRSYIRPTSELYEQVYQSLMNNQCCQDGAHQNTPVSIGRSIPSSHWNDLKSINSAANSGLGPPHSPTEHHFSELEGFKQDPNTKMIYNNLKRTKKNNNNNFKINSSKESRVLSPSEQSRLFQQQQQETTNLLVHIN